jgi:hypothetical protein
MARLDTHPGSGHPGLGAIFAALAAGSARPRYAFLVLQLVAEAAGEGGTAGPFVRTPQGAMGLRDWLCTQLRPMSERHDRRAALRARVVDALADRLTGDVQRDEPMIAAAVEEQALTVARTNLSRAISDLVKAGLLRRHYAGYATDHANRGGGRHAVYVIEPATLVALGKRPVPRRASSPPRQGELFAA